MISGAAVVEEARRWIDTPFHHQGRCLGHRVDCAGLVACVGQRLGLTTFDATDYTREPEVKRMKQILDRELIPIRVSDARAGDIFYCTYGSRQPRHLAIFTGAGLVHAFEDAGRCVEHGIDQQWRRRIRGAYRYPGVT